MRTADAAAHRRRGMEAPKVSLYPLYYKYKIRRGAPPVGALFRRIAGMLAVLIAVLGCSRLEFVYAFAGAAIEDKAALYFDLDEAGEDLIANQTEAFLAWHRRAMLPRYARFLDAQTAIVEQGGYDRKTVSAMLSGLRRLLDETVVGAAPFFAAVMVEQTAPDKLRTMRKRIAEQHAELVDALKSSYAERLEERIEDVTDNFERLLDELHAKQIVQVKIYANASLQYAKSWLVNRADRQRALTAFLGE